MAGNTYKKFLYKKNRYASEPLPEETRDQLAWQEDFTEELTLKTSVPTTYLEDEMALVEYMGELYERLTQSIPWQCLYTALPPDTSGSKVSRYIGDTQN